MSGAGDPPRRRDRAEPAGDAPELAQRVGQDRHDSPIRRTADSPGDLRERLKQFRDGHPSSPNHEDGSPREPAPDLSKFESAAEAHEHEPGSSGLAAGRADRASATKAKQPARMTTPNTQATATAKDGAQRYRSCKHSGNAMPSVGQPSSDLRSTGQQTSQDPGAARRPLPRLRGESGYRARAGPSVQGRARGDPEMKAVETEVPGARLVGLENCLKGEDRFKEKVAAELGLKPERSIIEIDAQVPGCNQLHLRVSMKITTWTAIEDVCGKLQERGNELLVRRNSWDDHRLQGHQHSLADTDGQIFEVQFHTADSFQAKQLTHVAYERLEDLEWLQAPRRPRTPRLSRSQVIRAIPVPDGVEAIPDYQREGWIRTCAWSNNRRTTPSSTTGQP